VAEFAPGDVVVLKSGSMRMLVERVDGDAVAVVVISGNRKSFITEPGWN
jgi:uncharacterized protein YodC (DUF2158 family)